jgi:hypothetical protein
MPTTLKTGSTLSTPNSGTTPGITVTQGAAAVSNQSTIQVMDYLNAPIFVVAAGAPSANCWGDKFGAYSSTTSSGCMFRADLSNGYNFSIGVVSFPDTAVNQGMNLRAGTGVPSASTVAGWAELGDIYHRRDGSSGTRIYVCTAAGSPGTWTAAK